MKKTTRLMALIVAMLCLPMASKAQNLQVLYDTERGCVTSTLEMFRPDAFGSTFYFVDMDYSPTAIGAYTEIAREFCFWQDTKWNWLSVHVEYDGGLSGTYSFHNNWLGGLTYSGHSDDFSKTWSLSAMYKAIPGLKTLTGECQMHNFQLTGVWGISFFEDWCSFSGFADFWSEGSTLVFLSEPQLWVNLNKIKGWDNINLSVGGEVELSNNFGGMEGFHVMPALGAKWTF
jgi:hypothetical protein